MGMTSIIPLAISFAKSCCGTPSFITLGSWGIRFSKRVAAVARKAYTNGSPMAFPGVRF